MLLYVPSQVRHGPHMIPSQPQFRQAISVPRPNLLLSGVPSSVGHGWQMIPSQHHQFCQPLPVSPHEEPSIAFIQRKILFQLLEKKWKYGLKNGCFGKRKPSQGFLKLRDNASTLKFWTPQPTTRNKNISPIIRLTKTTTFVAIALAIIQQGIGHRYVSSSTSDQDDAQAGGRFDYCNKLWSVHPGPRAYPEESDGSTRPSLLSRLQLHTQLPS